MGTTARPDASHVGFPVALVLAWAFQMTPDGVKRAKPVPAGPGSRLPFLAGLTVGMLAVSGVAFIFFGSDGEGADLGTRSLDPNARRSRFSTAAQGYETTIWRTQGRLAALLGDSARAIRAYERYLKIRQDVEAEVMPEVEAVRAALAQLQEG